MITPVVTVTSLKPAGTSPSPLEFAFVESLFAFASAVFVSVAELSFTYTLFPLINALDGIVSASFADSNVIYPSTFIPGSKSYVSSSFTVTG